MTRFDEPDLPEDLRDVDARLRDARLEFTALELDQLKRRVMNPDGAQAPIFGRTRGKTMKSRILTLSVAALLLGGTAGGAIAAGGGGGSSNAAKAEYKPGNGCGDKNHTHTGPPGNPGNDKCPPQAGGNGKSGK
ncbi:MAG: hypothetical protein WCB67_11265 [Solirubrobacteraceae bacterium]